MNQICFLQLLQVTFWPIFSPKNLETAFKVGKEPNEQEGEFSKFDQVESIENLNIDVGIQI